MVWAKPITRLAREFGLSDVGLAKMCRKHNIPLPERGYWAKLAAGKQVRKIPLPDPKNDQAIEIQERKPVPAEEKAAEMEVRKRERLRIETIGAIEVPAVLESPHRLTKMTQKYFEGIIKKIQRWEKVKNSRFPNWEDRPPMDDHGRYNCRPPDGFRLTVSLDKLDRALLFLDTLAKAIEANGFEIQNNIKDERKSYPIYLIEATKDGEGIRFHLSEGYKRRALSSKEVEVARKESIFARTNETVPSGKFNFIVTAREYYGEKRWSDGTKPLEAYLPSIIAEFLDLVPRQKQLRIKHAQEKKEHEVREHQRWLAQQKHQNQQEQYDEAITEARKLKELELLEAYLQKLEALYREAHGEMGSNVAAWFKLVRNIAQTQNPLVTRLHDLEELAEMAPAELEWMPAGWES